MKQSETAESAWLGEMRRIGAFGMVASPRGKTCKESLFQQVRWDADSPLIVCPERKLNYSFMFAEVFWILSGQNVVFHKNWLPYSDTGFIVQGAYGPKITEQALYVVQKLGEDPQSRQAVINIWRESPRASKDIPCTLSLQFLIRDREMHVGVTMRSSDVWMGLPYDMLVFTMVGYYILILGKQLGHIEKDVNLSKLSLTAGSMHLYEEHWELADKCELSDINQIPMLDFHGIESVASLIEHMALLRDNPNFRKASIGR